MTRVKGARYTRVMDPIQRAQQAGQRIEAIRADRNAAISQAATERRDAIREARDSMTVQEIADQLNITRARVYAILTGKE